MSERAPRRTPQNPTQFDNPRSRSAPASTTEMSGSVTRPQSRRANLHLLAELLPVLGGQKLCYDDACPIVLGHAFAITDEWFIAYPESIHRTIEDACVHIASLDTADEQRLLPSFVIDFDEDAPLVRQIHYTEHEISFSDEQTIPLAELSIETLRLLLGDTPPKTDPVELLDGE